MIRHDMATLAIQARRYREAVAHLQLAAKYMPDEPRIRKNLELAKRALERQRSGNR
jgi:Flp pilus assembly protein TadD